MTDDMPVNLAYQNKHKAKKTRSVTETRASHAIPLSGRSPSCRMRPHTYWNPPPSTQ